MSGAALETAAEPQAPKPEHAAAEPQAPANLPRSGRPVAQAEKKKKTVKQVSV